MDKFRYVLAPLEDFTDSAFRTLCYRHGCDMTFTVMTRVSSLVEKNIGANMRIKIPDGTPTEIQLLAIKEDDLKKFLAEFNPEKGFAGFNINLGCPDPDIVRLGMGCALMKRISRVSSLVNIIKDANYKISIKMRLGMNAYEKEKKVYLNLINSVDADYFIVHARHAKQSYKEPSDFSVFDECVKTGKDIIANGDIRNIEQADKLRVIGIKGVMVGRTAINNPGIFAKMKRLPEPSFEDLKKEYIKLADEHKTKDRYVVNVLKFMGEKTL